MRRESSDRQYERPMQNICFAGIKPAFANVPPGNRSFSGRHTTAHKAIASMLMISALVATGAGAAETNPLADQVRAANQRFADVEVAKTEGYAPIPCVSGPDGSGAMGVHYVNQKLIDDSLVDVAKPEAVLYEPGADGKLELVAVEYITPKGPAALGNQLFSFVNAPNRYGLPPFYELHVWAWRANATGTFSDMNPAVSCAAMMDGM
jgi:hypothetical protein